MANGSFEADVAAIVAAGTAPAHWVVDRYVCAGIDAAHGLFVDMCHDRGWGGSYARRVWEAARRTVEAREEDDIPF